MALALIGKALPSSPRGQEIAPWADSLKHLKDHEAQRQNSFREWSEDARHIIATMKQRALSAQQLAGAVRRQLKERTEADEEAARRLARTEGRQQGRANSLVLKAAQYCEEDRDPGGFLAAAQRYYVEQLQEIAKKVRALSEEKSWSARWETLKIGTNDALAQAEQALKVAESCQLDCVNLWARHENICRRRMQPGNNKSFTAEEDLWATEVAYRQASAALDHAVRKSHKILNEVQEQLVATSGEQRALIWGLLRDASVAIASWHRRLAEVLMPPDEQEDKILLPEVPPPPSSRENNPLVLEPFSPVAAPSWTPEPLPTSALVLRTGDVEMPPKAYLKNGKWQLGQLLLTSDGHVHCFSVDTMDTEAKSPLWHAEPKDGVSLSVDALTLTLQPAPMRWSTPSSHVVRLPNSTELDGWLPLLRRWWPSPEDVSTRPEPSSEVGIDSPKEVSIRPETRSEGRRSPPKEQSIRPEPDSPGSPKDTRRQLRKQGGSNSRSLSPSSPKDTRPQQRKQDGSNSRSNSPKLIRPEAAKESSLSPEKVSSVPKGKEADDAVEIENGDLEKSSPPVPKLKLPDGDLPDEGPLDTVAEAAEQLESPGWQAMSGESSLDAREASGFAFGATKTFPVKEEERPAEGVNSASENQSPDSPKNVSESKPAVLLLPAKEEVSELPDADAKSKRLSRQVASTESTPAVLLVKTDEDAKPSDTDAGSRKGSQMGLRLSDPSESQFQPPDVSQQGSPIGEFPDSPTKALLQLPEKKAAKTRTKSPGGRTEEKIEKAPKADREKKEKKVKKEKSAEVAATKSGNQDSAASGND